MVTVSLDLTWIVDGLAVGGRIPEARIDELARDHGIAVVVDLRGEACDDAIVLARHGLAFLHLPTVDLAGVSLAMLRAGVTFVSNALTRERRVLIHCEHGIGRSVLLALCVLVERGHAPLAALELAKSRRAVASPSPAQFEAWARWLRATGRAVPSFDEFAAIAYRHLGPEGAR